MQMCLIIGLVRGESLSAGFLYRRAVVVPVLVRDARQYSASQC